MPSDIHAITHVTALAGPSLSPISDAVVLIEGSSITAVGPSDGIDIPADAGVFDGHGATLIPGFIDAHVHIGFFDPSEVVDGGVTTARDLAWPPQEIAQLVSRSGSSDFDGPTILAAGPMLTAPGGYPTTAGWAPPGTGLEVEDADDAEAAVESVSDAGFSIVKIALNPPVGPVLDRETLVAIVDAAHERDLKVTGHIYGLHELGKAIDAGVDELAHMLMSDELIPPPMIDEMVAAGMTFVPTLSVFSGPGMRTAIANLHAFKKAGGRIVYGTDLGNEGPRPGIDPTEVKRMTQAGMSGLDIILSATVVSAEWLGLDGVGVIEVGAVADLVAVNGDPLTDPAVLSDLLGVWRRGQIRER